MNFFLVLVLLFSLFPSIIYTIRCYKCDATDECKTIKTGSSSDILEIIDCEYYCWKSISLGNVYRGCAKKRCAVSHTIGSFSSSVCCETDYCNRSNRLSSSSMTIILFIMIIFQNFW